MRFILILVLELITGLAIARQVEDQFVINDALLSSDLFAIKVNQAVYRAEDSAGSIPKFKYARWEEVKDGILDSEDWYKIQFINQSSVNQWVFRFPEIYSGKLFLRDVHGETLSEFDVGTSVATFDKPLVGGRYTVAPLDFIKSDTISLYVKGDFNQKPGAIEIGKRKTYDSFIHHLERLFQMFSGIFLVMILYNLCFYLILKEKSILSYCLMLFGFCLMVYTFFFSLNFNHHLGGSISIIGAALAVVGGAFYAIYFLHIRTGIIFRVIQAIGFLSALVALVECINLFLLARILSISGITAPLAAFLAFSVNLYFLFLGIYYTAKNKTNGKEFLYINTPLMIGAFIFIYLWIGITFQGAFAETDLVVGANYAFFSCIAAQMVLFSIATGYKIKNLQREKLEAQRILTGKLEAKVEERTLELNEAKLRIERKNKKLEVLNEVKNKILTTLSHDIKSPITNFESLIKLFQQNQISQAEINDFLPIISRETKNLNDFLTNLLHWAQAQMDGIRVNKTSVELEPLIDKIINQKAIVIEDKHLTISKNIMANNVNADESLLMICINNLFSNAIKFSFDNQKITINAYNGDGYDYIEVIDEGIGISDEDIERVSSLEFKRSRTGTKNEKGFGIGLKLVLEMMKEQGGELRIKGKENAGSTFTLALPAR